MVFFKLVVLFSVLNCCFASEVASDKAKGGRQKRLLFYDEEGNLVKTYKSPYSLDFIHNAEKVPFFGSFINMFRPSTLGVPTFYMIPVSEQVIQQINSDPVYQNKLLTVPRKEMIIEPNTLCSGKRTQIPAKSCRNFLNCWDGWAFEQECPEGLLFAKEGYCDYPHNVDCASRTNAPIVQPNDPKCMKDFEAFRNEENCQEFYICVDRTPVRFKCPADLAYNQELGVCDYAHRVNCQSNSQAVAMDESQPAIQPARDPATPDEPAIQLPRQPIIPAAIPPIPSFQQPIIPAATQPAIPPIPSFQQPEISNPTNQVPSCPQSPVMSPIVPQPPAGSASINLGSDGPQKNDGKGIITTNSEFRSQTFSSSHMAMSRQDAIRQLKLDADV